MAKIYGLFGTMNGKVADVVMVVRGGEQIVRKYQPTVSNPNTPGQVGARAKLKLLSQLSAVMSPFIAIPKIGNISSRNLFTKQNYPLATFADDEANIQLDAVQLTKSVVGLPAIGATRGTGLVVNVTLNGVDQDVSRVVYVAFSKGADNKLRYAGNTVVSESENYYWNGEMTVSSPNEELVVYAYGVRDNTEAARARFSNMEVVTAETVASLMVTRTLLESDITLTETRGVTVPAVV